MGNKNINGLPGSSWVLLVFMRLQHMNGIECVTFSKVMQVYRFYWVTSSFHARLICALNLELIENWWSPCFKPKNSNLLTLRHVWNSIEIRLIAFSMTFVVENHWFISLIILVCNTHCVIHTLCNTYCWHSTKNQFSAGDSLQWTFWVVCTHVILTDDSSFERVYSDSEFRKRACTRHAHPSNGRLYCVGPRGIRRINLNSMYTPDNKLKIYFFYLKYKKVWATVNQLDG